MALCAAYYHYPPLPTMSDADLHPRVPALRAYFEGPGRTACTARTLGNADRADEFLRNRLESAYAAGWDACAKHVADTLKLSAQKKPRSR